MVLAARSLLKYIVHLPKKKHSVKIWVTKMQGSCVRPLPIGCGQDEQRFCWSWSKHGFVDSLWKLDQSFQVPYLTLEKGNCGLFLLFLNNTYTFWTIYLVHIPPCWHHAVWFMSACHLPSHNYVSLHGVLSSCLRHYLRADGCVISP